MKKLAIIDLDTKREDGQAIEMMVVNNSERVRRARLYSEKFAIGEQKSRFYEKMFQPSLVETDQLEENAREWLEMIEATGAQIIYLTSRPHTMKAETERWLEAQEIGRASCRERV